MVQVIPEQTDEILANPGMGWQTFHRTADKDKSLPSWIPSTVHYSRWGWDDLEPEPGRINVEYLDRILAETSKAGQTLAFRVMCCSSRADDPYHPAWLRDKGGRILKTRYQSGPELEVPDLDHPVILRAHLDFIRRLGEKYDGHPALDHVDIGSVGWWGEWHMSGAVGVSMPSEATQRAIVDAYLAAFKKTPLLMLIGGGPALSYAISRGAGWRADCLGDLGGFSKNWNHMRQFYTQALTKANAGDAWQRAPVAWETCWDMRKWVEEGWSLRYIFNYALALHGSYINNKSAPLPTGAEVEPELRRFLKRLGYRFVIRQLEHPPRVAPGGRLAIRTEWQNLGSAPCYKPYRVAFRLRNASRQQIFVGKTTVDRWMPGSVDIFAPGFLDNPPDLPPGPVYRVVESFTLSKDLSPGKYELAVGIVGLLDEVPVVQLGIRGRAEDGWYPLSSIEIER